MLCLCLNLWGLAGLGAPGQADSKRALTLSRRNPDGWFSLSIPEVMGEAERHVSVNGGTYSSEGLEINYTYWAYENTPYRFQGRHAVLACPEKGRQARTWRARIDGKRAVIQRCAETGAGGGPRYVYYVTFPEVKVFDGHLGYGMFNLEVTYRDPRYLPVAERVVRSIDFVR